MNANYLCDKFPEVSMAGFRICKLKERPANYYKVIKWKLKVPTSLGEEVMLEMNWKKLTPTISSSSYLNCYNSPGQKTY